MLIQADALHIPLADNSVHCVVTSPPYFGLRDYGTPGQLGLEPTWQEYVANMVAVFREVWRVLRPDGTAWLNLGDSFNSNPSKGGSGTYNVRNGHGEGYARGFRPGAGRADGIVDKRGQRNRNGVSVSDLKPKDLMGIPWRVAFALQEAGWYLRSDIIWAKPNPMPESVTDRPAKSHEYIFLLAKRGRYFYDSEAIKEPLVYPNETRRPLGSKGAWQMDGREQRENGGGKPYDGYPSARNRRTVWNIATAPYSGAHFATYPPALVEPCLLAGTSARGVCPACGAPWERVVETTVAGNRHVSPKDNNPDRNDGANEPSSRLHNQYFRYDSRTTGWSPTCACGRADTAPAVVLDPFNGSGTTGMVARQHGRRYVGLDISASYLRELALPRAENTQTAAALASLPLFSQETPA